jgi:tripartite-type tricarboxylate transporter receptor subunit TctC
MLMRSMIWALCVLWLSPLGQVHAQQYPTKPVRIIAAEVGGANDIPARLVARGLSARLGQSVVVVNRPGPALAGELLARSPADGYTLLFYGSSIWLQPFLQESLSWDPVKDFAPITLSSSSPNVLVVNNNVPANSVPELIALAKARPGQLNYGTASAGSGNHLAAELFKIMANVNVVGIKYKGAASALGDMMAGRIQFMFPAAASVAGHIKAGRLRALAVTTLKPSPLGPGLPTVASSGLAGYESKQVHGIFSTVGTAPAIINRLNQDIVAYLRLADTKARFFDLGLETVGSTPEELAATVKSDMMVLGKLIKDLAIKAQ